MNEVLSRKEIKQIYGETGRKLKATAYAYHELKDAVIRVIVALDVPVCPSAKREVRARVVRELRALISEE